LNFTFPAGLFSQREKRSILAYNIWLWAFYFKIDHSTRIEMVSTALELSPEAIERFLNEIG
jgi:hypothetical protein